MSTHGSASRVYMSRDGGRMLRFRSHDPASLSPSLSRAALLGNASTGADDTSLIRADRDGSGPGPVRGNVSLGAALEHSRGLPSLVGRPGSGGGPTVLGPGRTAPGKRVQGGVSNAFGGASLAASLAERSTLSPPAAGASKVHPTPLEGG
jgi:hypothetical protein